MFNWPLFSVVFAVSFPGVLISLPRLVAQLDVLLDEKSQPARNDRLALSLRRKD